MSRVDSFVCFRILPLQATCLFFRFMAERIFLKSAFSQKIAGLGYFRNFFFFLSELSVGLFCCKHLVFARLFGCVHGLVCAMYNGIPVFICPMQGDTGTESDQDAFVVVHEEVFGQFPL